MNVEKRAIRHALRDRRRHLSAAFVEAASAAACARLESFDRYQSAASVVAYVAHENEISAAPLFPAIVQSDRRLYLPRTVPGRPLSRWRPGDPLVVGEGGVQEPIAGTAEQSETPAVVLLPVVAWDNRGTRIGRGGGFYDRLLAELSEGFVRIGLAYEFQECPELPRDPWDVPLHYVITERRIIRCQCSEGMRFRSLQKGGVHP
jgi:5-formyltetrahydrofolate cyclo-ligase